MTTRIAENDVEPIYSFLCVYTASHASIDDADQVHTFLQSMAREV